MKRNRLHRRRSRSGLKHISQLLPQLLNELQVEADKEPSGIKAQAAISTTDCLSGVGPAVQTTFGFDHATEAY